MTLDPEPGEYPRRAHAAQAVRTDASADRSFSAPAIALSWQRCVERGISQEQTGPLPPPADLPLPDAEWAARTLALARPAIEDVYQFLEGSRSAIGFADSDARLLDSVGDADYVAELAAVGWVAGSCWSEACSGSNGLALALTESFPSQVRGAQHYCAFLRLYCTSAAPVFDSLGGLVGAVVAITPAEQASAHTLGMVSAAASAVTGELRMNLWLSSANELTSELNAILQTLSEGILMLRPDGTVSHMNGRAGTLLGIVPARVSGRRLAELVNLPTAFTDALRLGRELHDEEMTFFRASGDRVSCLCTLRPIASPATLAATAVPTITDVAGATARLAGGRRPGGLLVVPRRDSSGYVVTLRSIERVQRLVHRMSGAQARMSFSHIVGQSAGILEAVRLARIAAASDSTVLLHGETGTGKEVFAQSVHTGSARANGPFVALNCAAIPRELITSELFGYEGGAFTGADRQGRPGKFELASGGTLFLDEIGDMPPDLQTSLLRAIETRTIVRVGGQHVIPVDVRIIAATHKNLADEVQMGSFRTDLYFRLNVFPIEVPPLRERPGDVELLLHYVLEQLSTRLNRALGVEPDALVALEAYSWPGNVRELENVIERAVYVSERGVLALGDLPSAMRHALDGVARDINAGQPQHQFGGLGAAPRTGLPQALYASTPSGLRHESELAEALHIQRSLRASGGNVAEAARMLGISRTTLWRKKRRYHL